MNEYDVSVVIPVYNCHKYIRKCVRSILNQDYDRLDKVQIVLVNDGSTDESLEVCQKIKNENPNYQIEIITGENQGVSAARNKGIKASKGKYILFIDGDDYISKTAIRKLVKFFDKHYEEVDIVTYPMYKYDVQKEKKEILPRYTKQFKETGIYDLEENYFAIQPTMNIIIKNMRDNNVLFNEDIFFHEDTLFNTEIILDKLKIGYINNAKYIYRVYGESTTDYKSNPLYSFEQFMFVYEYLFDKAEKKYGHIPKFLQIMALNVIRYRLNQDRLFPYYLEGEEWDKAYNRIVDLINKIEDETIAQYQDMDKFHKMYLFGLKKDNNVNICNSYCGAYTINKGNHILAIENNIEIVINRIKLKNGKLYILGFLKSVLFNYKNPNLFINYIDNNKEEHTIELDLRKTNASLYKTNVRVANFYEFDCTLKIEDINEFEFEAKLNDSKLNYSFFFNKFSPFNSKTGSFKIYDRDYRLQYLKGVFYISKPKIETRKKDIKRAKNRYKKIDNKINIIRDLARKTKPQGGEKIWIYIDRKDLFDNAYFQFKHDIKIKNDNIRKYYVLDDIKKYKHMFTNEELKYVIKYGSLKHKLLFINSDKVLTSFSSLAEHCPLSNEYAYYKDLLNYDLIYLQHGILHANLPKMYSKILTRIDKFVVSSEFEKNNLMRQYGYKEEDLICTGMPRLDEGSDENGKIENKIIFAPSWRKYLIGETYDRKRAVYMDKFIDSDYYKETIKFLTNEKLLNELKKNNLVLEFNLHPIFAPYKECFDEVINENIIVSEGNVDLSKYKSFITDYSSYQFDFVKLQRPIIYFVPDLKEFKAGLHSYRKLDLPHEEAFGKLFTTGEETAEEIIKMINNDFKPEEPYNERMKNFFYKVDNRREKLYKILKESN